MKQTNNNMTTIAMKRKQFVEIKDEVQACKALQDKFEAEKHQGRPAYNKCIGWRQRWIEINNKPMTSLKKLGIKVPMQQHGGVLDEENDVEMMEIEPLDVGELLIEEDQQKLQLKEMFCIIEKERKECQKRMERLNEMIKVANNVMNKL
jgi:hypothetical protein